jgi:hypothetical protein
MKRAVRLYYMFFVLACRYGGLAPRLSATLVVVLGVSILEY